MTGGDARSGGTAHRLTAVVSVLLALVCAVAMPTTSRRLARALFDDRTDAFGPTWLLVVEVAGFLGSVLLARYHWRRRK